MTNNYRFRLQNTTYLLFFGLVLIMFAIPLTFMIWQTTRIYTTFQKADGIVIGSKVGTSCSAKGSTRTKNCRDTYYQIIQYKKVDQTYKFQTTQSYYFDRYSKDQNLNILYNPSDLNEGVIDDEFVYLGVIILLPIYIISATFFFINIKIRQNNSTNYKN